jgi:hypothetical protein
MADRAAQCAWVSRVLGVTFDAAARGGSNPDAGNAIERWKSALLVWQAASDLVDKQISYLGAAMRETRHPVLMHIADYGLNGVTGNNKVRLMAAIGDVGQGEGGKLEKGRAKALATIIAFQKHLSNDPRVAVCDANPLGVAVSVRATLGDALKTMESALRE